MTSILALMRSCSALACWSACSLAFVPVLSDCWRAARNQSVTALRFSYAIEHAWLTSDFLETLKLADLRVPVLVQAYPDEFRRDLEAYRHE